MDVSCVFCGGKGCRRCKGTGWMEIVGCGNRLADEQRPEIPEPILIQSKDLKEADLRGPLFCI